MKNKLLLQEIYQIELCPITLLERSMAEINNFDPEEMIADETLLELFKLIYEIEYKYSMMAAKGFSGNERRKDNILKILERVGEESISALGGTFIDVFGNWLEHHAILSPRTWASKRLEDLIENGYGEEEIYENIKWEFENDKDYSNYNSFEQAIQNNIDKMPALKNFLTTFYDEKDNMYDDLESEGYEEFGERYGEEFESKEEAREFIDEYETDPSDVIGNFGAEEVFKHVRQDEDVFEELYVHIVFPAWYAHWSAEGIDETRANVEDVYKQLQNIDSLPFKQQNALINIATNTTHQTGSMMEYYSNRYDVDERDLRDLSNRDVEDWNEELREIGVQI
jgi:hypothetical protein